MQILTIGSASMATNTKHTHKVGIAADSILPLLQGSYSQERSSPLTCGTPPKISPRTSGRRLGGVTPTPWQRGSAPSRTISGGARSTLVEARRTSWLEVAKIISSLIRTLSRGMFQRIWRATLSPVVPALLNFGRHRVEGQVLAHNWHKEFYFMPNNCFTSTICLSG